MARSSCLGSRMEKNDNIRVVNRPDSEKNEGYVLDFENDLFSCVCVKTCCVSYIAMFMIYRNQKKYQAYIAELKTYKESWKFDLFPW